LLRVKELLNQKDNKLFYIPPQMSVRSAVDLLVDKNVGALPVMNEDGLLGIFSERDFTRYLVEQGEAILEMPVSDFMTHDVVSVLADTPLEECMRMMIERKFRHLLVREDEKIIGIVSMRDLASRLYRS